MRALRLLGYALLLILTLLIATGVIIYRNQRRIAELALTQIHQRTGCEIQITGTEFHVGSHLSVVLKNPRVKFNGQEVATLDDIRAILSFRSIFHNYGLPLYRLGLDRPRVRIPVRQTDVTVGGIPRLDAQMVEALQQGLDALSGTAMQVDVYDGAVFDSTGLGIVEHVDLHAYRRHYRKPGNWPWLLDFAAAFTHPPVDGLHVSGSLTLGPQNGVPNTIARGQSWFWGFELKDFPLGSLTLTNGADGHLQFVLDNVGVLSGAGEANIHGLTLGGNALLRPQSLGDAELLTNFRATPDQIDLSKVTLRRANAEMLHAQATMMHPYEDNRTLTFSANAASLKLADISAFVRAIRDLPQRFKEPLTRVDSGGLTVTTAAIDTGQPLRDWNLQTLRDNLHADMVVNDGGYRPPEATKLPRIHHLEIQVSYAENRLKLRQGSADLGNSRFEQISLRSDLRDLTRRIPYDLRGRADLDLDELYPALDKALHDSSPAVAAHITKLQGHSTISLDANGDFNPQLPGLPKSYLATIGLDDLTATTINPKVEAAFRQGRAKITPETITVENVRVLPEGPNGGDIVLNGVVEAKAGSPVFHDFSLEPHRINIGRWLPLAIKSDALMADGSIGGALRLNTDPRRTVPAITGRLTLADGHLTLGFVRSPIAARSATLSFDGKGLELSLPGGQFENAPVDFRLKVPDLSNPAVRLDATAAKFDFLALNFIRLPWSPRRPPHFFAVPISGHISAHRATFDRLPLSEVAADFSRDDTDWHVRNFVAEVFKGHVSLSIDGKTGPNNWIHVITKVDGSDMGSLCRMIAPEKRPTITGSLVTNGDIWVNTDVDFFDTLAGTINLKINDGVLDRFTLLSRVLGLIDLKSWLTAQIPDPTVHGLPFTSISGVLKGRKGDFYTEDLRLEGPVMDMAAKGHMQFGSSEVDMEVGAFPFNTANWIIHQIPIVGTNLAEGSSDLVAAYFHVHGPLKDPSVVPMPVTSVAEFVKKMLGLPINIIVPNTIK